MMNIFNGLDTSKTALVDIFLVVIALKFRCKENFYCLTSSLFCVYNCLCLAFSGLALDLVKSSHGIRIGWNNRLK